MAFIQFVRVRDNATGHEYDVVDTAVDPDAHEVLTKYPPNLTGIPRPAKHRTAKGARLAAKPARKRAVRKPRTTKATAPAATTKEK